jgi:hypothetical protein
MTATLVASAIAMVSAAAHATRAHTINASTTAPNEKTKNKKQKTKNKKQKTKNKKQKTKNKKQKTKNKKQKTKKHFLWINMSSKII